MAHPMDAEERKRARSVQAEHPANRADLVLDGTAWLRSGVVPEPPARSRRARRRRTAREDLQSHRHPATLGFAHVTPPRDAGESHGPALVAIVTGLPAGLELDARAIDADLARRQEGYGRSPRQRSSRTPSRCSRGSGTAARSGRRSRSSCGTATTRTGRGGWRPGRRRESRRQGDEAGDAAASGHADLAGVQKFGHDDVRTRSSARRRGTPRCTSRPGAVAKALLAEIGISVAGSPSTRTGCARDRRGAEERDTVGGIVEVRATGVPPGLGSYATKEDRLDARLAAAVMGIQAVKGVEIGDGFALASLRGSEAHDEIDTSRAGRRIVPAASRRACRTARRSSFAPR